MEQLAHRLQSGGARGIHAALAWPAILGHRQRIAAAPVQAPQGAGFATRPKMPRFPRTPKPMANIQPHPQMANAIRALAMDAVQQANSGHPGAPRGMADMAVALWGQHLKHNPADPRWFDRDRFVLSNGPGSMLLYALLHLTGYDLSIDEFKNFRQLHSKTAGHPEVGLTPGVETTTGPLGQGIANAVGFALAEKLLAGEFNRAGPVGGDDHRYVFLGDGCLMEGVSHEAVALAGVWKLHKLIALYDDNGISIDGQVPPWFAENPPLPFVACGWNVIGPIDGHDADKVASAIAEAKKQTERPTLIVCKTRIGQASPNPPNTPKTHANPPGAEQTPPPRQKAARTPPPHRLQGPDRPGQPEPRQQRQSPWRAAGGRRSRAGPRRTGLDQRAVRGRAGHLRRLGRPGQGPERTSPME